MDKHIEIIDKLVSGKFRYVKVANPGNACFPFQLSPTVLVRISFRNNKFEDMTTLTVDGNIYRNVDIEKLALKLRDLYGSTWREMMTAQFVSTGDNTFEVGTIKNCEIDMWRNRYLEEVERNNHLFSMCERLLDKLEARESGRRYRR